MTGRPRDPSEFPVERPLPAMSGGDPLVHDDHMDHTDRVREALQDCLARIEAGAAPADAVAACPDAGLRPHLAILVAPAMGLGELPAIPAARGDAIRASLDQLAAELFPVGSPAPQEVHEAPAGRFPIRLITIALIATGLALLAWFGGRGGMSGRPSVSTTTPPFSSRSGLSQGGSVDLAGEAGRPAPSPASFGRGGRGVRAGLPASLNPSSTAENRAIAPCAAILGTDGGTADDGAGAAPVPAGSAVRITGRVVDADCRPIPDAIVVLAAPDAGDEFLARTERDGTYTLSLEPGRYHAEVLAEGFALRGWFDGGSYFEPQPAAPQALVDVRAGRSDPPARVDFVLTGRPPGSPTGVFR